MHREPYQDYKFVWCADFWYCNFTEKYRRGLPVDQEKQDKLFILLLDWKAVPKRKRNFCTFSNLGLWVNFSAMAIYDA